MQPGHHRSHHPGSIGAFVTHQPYTGGDDLRRIDWPIVARTGRLFTRRYETHTQQRYWLALDVSSSMTFAGLPSWLRGRESLVQPSTTTQPQHVNHPLSKLAYCQSVAMALCQIITWQHDQVGIALLADRLMEALPPSCSRTHLHHLHERLHTLQPKPTAQLTAALTQLFHRTQQPGVLVLMSDFLCDDVATIWATLQQFKNAGWSLVLGHVNHPDELALPGNLPVQWVDMETGTTLHGSPMKLRADYQSRMTKHLHTMQSKTWALGGTYHRWVTDEPWLLAVENMLTSEAR